MQANSALPQLPVDKAPLERSTEQLIRDAYAVVQATDKWEGNIVLFPNGPMCKDGLAQSSFPCPNNETLGIRRTTGLGVNLVFAELTLMRKTDEGELLLRFEGYKADHKTIVSEIILFKRPSVTSWILTPFLDRKLETAYRTAEAATQWIGKINLLPDGVFSKLGVLKAGFLCPDDKNFGTQVGINIGINLVSAHLTSVVKIDDRHYKLTFEGTNNKGKCVTRTRVLHKRGDEKNWALESEIKYELKTNVYPTVEKRKIWEGEIKLLPEAVHWRGATLQKGFTCPDNQSLRELVALGLGLNLSDARLVKVEKVNSQSYIFYFDGNDGKGKKRNVSHVFFKECKEAKWEVISSIDFEFRTQVYKRVKEHGIWTGRLDIFNRSIGKSGKLYVQFLCTDGKSFGSEARIGLGINLKEAHLRSVTRLTDSKSLYVIEARNERKTVTGRFVIDTKDRTLTVINPSRSRCDQLKGYALDRLVASAMTSDFFWKRRFWESPLTGKIVEPNLSSDQSLIHAKWGNSWSECRDYLLANLCLAHLRGRALFFVVAEEKHLDYLKEVSRRVCLDIKSDVDVNILTATEFLSERQGMTSEQGRDILCRIEGLAIADEEEALVAYADSFDRARNPVSHEATRSRDFTSDDAWNAHNEFLFALSPVELNDLISRHLPTSSLWHRNHHLRLAAVACYILENHSDEEVRNSALALYPNLTEFPGAHVFLRRLLAKEEEAGRPAEELDPEHSDPRFERFDLRTELHSFYEQNEEGASVKSQQLLLGRLLEAARRSTDNPLDEVLEILKACPGEAFRSNAELQTVANVLLRGHFSLLEQILGQEHPAILGFKEEGREISENVYLTHLPEKERVRLQNALILLRRRLPEVW